MPLISEETTYLPVPTLLASEAAIKELRVQNAMRCPFRLTTVVGQKTPGRAGFIEFRRGKR